MNEVLSITASVFSMASMVTYIIGLVKGHSKPNPATWIIWLVIGVINLLTYFFMTEGFPLKALPLCFVVIGIIVVTIYSLINGKFSPLNKLDRICLYFALMVGVFWRLSGDPILSNLILQITYVISFIPTITALHKEEIHENYGPWLLAVIGYFFMIVVIINTWEAASWVELVHPVVNGLIGNGIIVYYALIHPRE